MFWLLGGLVLGLVASMWWGPRLVTWWYTPPGSGVGATLCTEQIRGATERLVQWQLISGVVLGLVLALLAALWRGRHAQTRPVPPPPATPLKAT
jgi:hypothetical protein